MSTQGSVKRDDSGKWYFIIDITRVNGQRSQMKRRGFATKKLASEAMAIVVADQSRGSFVRPKRGTVGTFLLEEWLPAKVSSLKPSTAATYRSFLSTYVTPHIGAMELSKVDAGTLNALYSLLLADGRTGQSGRKGGLAAKTVRNVHGMLHRAFADAVKWRRLSVNPCDAADQPRKNESEMMLWTGAQMRIFRDSVADDRLAGVWRLLLASGMRRGELLGIRWTDLDLTSGSLTIRQTMTMVGGVAERGTPKTRSGSRTIAIDAGTVAALRTWKKQQTSERLQLGTGWRGGADLVVTEPDGSAVHPEVFSRRFKAQAKAAGLPIIRFHDARHSYATAALKAGVPVKVLSQRLGHADVSVTLRIYAHVMPGDDEAAADLAAAAIFGS